MQRGSLADLTAFIAVADHRSLRAAASRLGVTPSALSHSMRQLELLVAGFQPGQPGGTWTVRPKMRSRHVSAAIQ
jgi:hypothetical protein